MKIRFRDTCEPFVKYLIEIVNRVKATFFISDVHTWQHLVSVSLDEGEKSSFLLYPRWEVGERIQLQTFECFFFFLFLLTTKYLKKYFLLIVLLLLYNSCLATQLYTISNCLKNSWDGHLCRVIRYHSDTV